MLYNEVTDWKNVNEMYKYCIEYSLPLLSNFNSPFWGQYVINFERYDKAFAHMFKSFRYYNQEPFTQDNTIDMVTLDFIDDVYNHLMFNEKKYNELFKIQIMNVTSINDDFYVEEIMNNLKNINSDYNLGARKDTNIDNTGSRVDETEDKKMAFNSNSYVDNTKQINNIGNQTFNSTFNKGNQTDTEKRNEKLNQKIITKGYHNNPNDNLRKFIANWNSWDFYGHIFKKIADEMLLS